MAKQQTVIFDFDGTLVDSFWPGFRICNQIAEEFGFRRVAEDEIDKCRDMSTRELLKFVGVPLYKLPLIVKRMRQDIKAEIPKIKIVSGIETCLKGLRDAGSVLGIVTTNDKNNVATCLSNNRVFSYFDFLHTSINLFGKHRILRRTIRVRGIDSDRAIYVGDENRDIEAAKKCKIKGVAVGWGFQSRKKLLSTKPDFFASTPMEIVNYVAGLAKNLSQ